MCDLKFKNGFRLSNLKTMAELNDYVEENSKSFTNDVTLENWKHEIENYKQELYDLRRKFQIAEATHKDVEENNDKLEQLVKEKSEQIDKLKQSVQEIQRDRSMEKLEHDKTVSTLETSLNNKSQENNELKKLIQEQNKALQAESIPCSVEESTIVLENEIVDLKQRLTEEQKSKEELDILYKDMQNQNIELENILQVTKSSLNETKQVLENTREELAICRNQLEMAKITPADANNKGNSLFAEVEDKRKELVNKTTALQSKYQEMKRIDAIRANEIKVLKAEKAVLMRKWETDSSYLLEDNNNLVEKYKNKVVELSKELELLRKKNQGGTGVENLAQPDRYLQSLLMGKQEEINVLRSKIQTESINMLMLEDKKLEITKQYRYWKYKAMSLEAQILLAKSKFESESLDTWGCQTILDDLANQTKTSKMDFEEEKKINQTTGNAVQNRDSKMEAMFQESLEKSKMTSKNQAKTGILKARNEPNCQKVEKTLQFSKETKSTGSTKLEKQKKDYPIVYVSTKQDN